MVLRRRRVATWIWEVRGGLSREVVVGEGRRDHRRGGDRLYGGSILLEFLVKGGGQNR